MKTFFRFFRELPIARFVVASLLGAVLLITTACNNGDEVGARPNNLPVQMGGQNNPHKSGGDGYTQFNTDRQPVQNPTGKQASLNRSVGTLIATHEATSESESDDFVLYPASGEHRYEKGADSFFEPDQQQELINSRQNPDEGQPKVVGNAAPNGEVLQKAGQTFKDASGFLAKPNDTSFERIGL